MDGKQGVLRLLAVAAFACGLAGCASPGVPRPPSLHLPAPVTDLTASRVGDDVLLRWTAPTRTTDGLDVIGATTVEVCRDAVVERPGKRGAGDDVPCTSVLREAGHAGPSVAVDHLPAERSADVAAGAVLAYRVRVLNASGRGAAASTAVWAPAGPGVVQVEDFRVKQTKAGVVITWRGGAAGTDGTVEVLRTEVSGAGAATKAASKPGAKAFRAPGEKRRRNSGEARLRADGLESRPGGTGMIDQTATLGATYTYTAERVRTVTNGGKTMTMRGKPTAAVSVALTDTFAPEAPRGLASVPGTTGTGAATRPTIDLSWEPSVEADVAGYFVYRVDVGAGEAKGRRLTEAPVAGAAYRDMDVTAGKEYEYRVSAVDRAGNESAASAPARDRP